jgi:hypothetical protein
MRNRTQNVTCDALHRVFIARKQHLSYYRDTAISTHLSLVTKQQQSSVLFFK